MAPLIIRNQTIIPTIGKPGSSFFPADYQLHYKLDGNDANLTPAGSPSIVSAPGGSDQRGYAFTSNDSTFITAVPDSAKVAIGSGEFTFFARIRNPGGQTVIGEFIRTGLGTTANEFRVFYNTNGTFSFRTNSSNKTSSGTIRAGVWESIAITCSGSGGTLNFYKNGSFDSTDTAQTYNITDSGSLDIGRFADAQFDDIYFYDRALSASEITAIHNDKKDLWTPLNDSSITGFWDPNVYASISEAGGLISAISNQVSGGASFTQGIGGRELIAWDTTHGFNNGNHYAYADTAGASKFLDIDNANIYPSSGTFALHLIAKPIAVTQNDEALWGVRDSTLNGFEIQSGNATQFNGNVENFGGGFSDYPLTGGPYTAHTLFSTLFDYSAGTVKTYVCGDLKGSASDYTGKIEYLTEATRWNCGRTLSDSPEAALGPVAITTDVTDSTREKYEGYYCWSRGDQGDLPSGHTYKNNPPLA